MPRYAADAKEKVRDAVDFLDLVGQRVEVRRAGMGSYKALCPFHEERSPSLSIDPGKGFFHCFGCGEGGDVFRWVELTEGLDFVGALEWLADRYGVTLELAEEDADAARARRRRERLLELLARTATFYARHLWESAEAAKAREYLAARGMQEWALREFRVGFSPKRWDTVLLASRRAGYSEDELLAAGVCQRSERSHGLYDRFRGRIMFPLADRRGNVLGFGARTMGDGEGPKYLNSGDGEVFHKGENLYAADLARAHAAKAGEVILAEGYTDVIALHQAGLRNTVGLMGTALTDRQVDELARLAPTVLLALDADSAGQEAMIRAAQVAARRRLELRVVPLPAGADPAELLLAEGADAVRERVSGSVPFVAFRVERELTRGDLASAEGKDRIVAALAPIFSGLPPSALHDELLAHAAERMGVAPSRLSAWMAARRPARAAAAAAAGPSPAEGRSEARNGAAVPRPAEPPPAFPDDAVSRAERAFLAACLAVPSAGPQRLAETDIDATFQVPVHRRAAALVRDHPEDITAAVPPEDHDLGRLAAALRARAADLTPTAAVVEAEAVKLEFIRLDAAIAAARAAGEGGVTELVQRRQAVAAELSRALERAQREGGG